MKRATYFGATWQKWVAWTVATQVSTHILQNSWHWAHHHYWLVLIANVIIWDYAIADTFHFRDIKRMVDVDA